jgi:DNA repair protein RadC
VVRALRCLEQRFRYPSEILNNTQTVRAYLQLQLAEERNEVFAVLFLDTQNRLFAFERLFFGTINATAVHARVIVQRAFEHNAAKVIFAHNHPSGNCNPSQADKEITHDLRQTLSALNIAVIDHIIVSCESTYSFAEHGLM